MIPTLYFASTAVTAHQRHAKATRADLTPTLRQQHLTMPRPNRQQQFKLTNLPFPEASWTTM